MTEEQVGRQVAVVGCDTYDADEVYEAVRDAFVLLGGLDAFITPGERVLVKPNLLQGLPPERCVTTHPAVVRAVALQLVAHGCQVTIADSPGGGIRYRPHNLNKVYQTAGYESLMAERGITFNMDTGYGTRSFPGGKSCTQFPIITPALEADHIIGVSKAKTHMWTLATGAAKNLFGLIPGLQKPLFHSRYRSPDRFAEMIVDLNELMRPRFQVMDAIIAMEGDGPTSGNPRKIGAVLASPDYTALDVVMSRLMGIPPLKVPTIRAAVMRGLATTELSEIEVVGDDISQLIIPDFCLPATYGGSRKELSPNTFISLLNRLGKIYALYPAVDPGLCEHCGRCSTICPMDAISMESGIPHITRSRCIRCYCCHEICPVRAMQLNRGVPGRLLDLVTKKP